MGAAQSKDTTDRGNGGDTSEQPWYSRPFSFSPTSNWIRLNSSYTELYDGIVSLVLDNKYADLVIICGSDRYPVHRAIVCPRSKFFDDHCTPRPGQRDYASPAKPTKIWIDPSDCESQILAAVLTFLYTLDYSADGHQHVVFGLPHEIIEDRRIVDDAMSAAWGDRADDDDDDDDDDDSYGSDSENEAESRTMFTQGKATPSSGHSLQTQRGTNDPSNHPNELVFHVQVCAAAHRFGIGSLCDVANVKLAKRLASSHWEKEMIDCIREVYRHSGGGQLGQLRDAVVKSARSRFRTLKTCDGWDGLVHDFPEFAAEILQRL